MFNLSLFSSLETGLVNLKGNPEVQPCQPKENHILPNSFTQIYILFAIGFTVILNSEKVSLKCPLATNLNVPLNSATSTTKNYLKNIYILKSRTLTIYDFHHIYATCTKKAMVYRAFNFCRQMALNLALFMKLSICIDIIKLSKYANLWLTDPA